VFSQGLRREQSEFSTHPGMRKDIQQLPAAIDGDGHRRWGRGCIPQAGYYSLTQDRVCLPVRIELKARTVGHRAPCGMWTIVPQRTVFLICHPLRECHQTSSSYIVRGWMSVLTRLLPQRPLCTELSTQNNTLRRKFTSRVLLIAILFLS
jgi:hypothetical protein